MLTVFEESMISIATESYRNHEVRCDGYTRQKDEEIGKELYNTVHQLVCKTTCKEDYTGQEVCTQKCERQ